MAVAVPRSSAAVWRTLAKQTTGASSISKSEAIDGVLCNGWIDGQFNPFDDYR
jgi:uncharacterized protein YdeI (YjbR/CyaY-like superfamily)